MAITYNREDLISAVVTTRTEAQWRAEVAPYVGDVDALIALMMNSNSVFTRIPSGVYYITYTGDVFTPTDDPTITANEVAGDDPRIAGIEEG